MTRLTDEQLGQLTSVERWVNSAVRQERQLQRGWLTMNEILREFDGVEDFEEPPHLAEAAETLADSIYFLVLTSHHALVTAPKRAKTVSLPPARTGPLVTKLRDVYEHWEQWLPTETDLANLRPWSGPGSKSKSGRYLGEMWPRANPRACGGTSDGVDVIAGVLPVALLLADLSSMADAVDRYTIEHRATFADDEDA